MHIPLFFSSLSPAAPMASVGATSSTALTLPPRARRVHQPFIPDPCTLFTRTPAPYRGTKFLRNYHLPRITIGP